MKTIRIRNNTVTCRFTPVTYPVICYRYLRYGAFIYFWFWYLGTVPYILFTYIKCTVSVPRYRNMLVKFFGPTFGSEFKAIPKISSIMMLLLSEVPGTCFILICYSVLLQDQEITCMAFGEDETEILMGLRNQSVKIFDVRFRLEFFYNHSARYGSYLHRYHLPVTCTSRNGVNRLN